MPTRHNPPCTPSRTITGGSLVLRWLKSGAIMEIVCYEDKLSVAHSPAQMLGDEIIGAYDVPGERAKPGVLT